MGKQALTGTNGESKSITIHKSKNFSYSFRIQIEKQGQSRRTATILQLFHSFQMSTTAPTWWPVKIVHHNTVSHLDGSLAKIILMNSTVDHNYNYYRDYSGCFTITSRAGRRLMPPSI